MAQYLRVQLDDPQAQVPYRSSDGAVGYDLHSIENRAIEPGGKAIIDTGIKVAIPPGHYGRIAPRSGFSWNTHSTVGAGVIDPDYRGRVKVLLFNLSSTSIASVKKGERIAQLILERVNILDTLQVSTLDDTERGEGGFGSTGV